MSFAGMCNEGGVLKPGTGLPCTSCCFSSAGFGGSSSGSSPVCQRRRFSSSRRSSSLLSLSLGFIGSLPKIRSSGRNPAQGEMVAVCKRPPFVKRCPIVPNSTDKFAGYASGSGRKQVGNKVCRTGRVIGVRSHKLLGRCELRFPADLGSGSKDRFRHRTDNCAWRYCVDIDASPFHLGCERLAKANKRSLGAGISRQIWTRRGCTTAGDVDDPATGRRKLRNGLTAQSGRREEVNSKCPFPIGQRGSLEWSYGPLIASSIDQSINAVQLPKYIDRGSWVGEVGN